MSPRERDRLFRRSRHQCAACRERKARFRHDGRVKADRDHVLCFQCFRAERERLRARQLAVGAVTASALLGVSAPSASRHSLSDAQVAHRVRMLAHLEQQARVARCR